MRPLRSPTPLIAALALAACGDIGALEIDVTFPSEEAELRTRALRFVVREVPPDGSSGCDALWSDPVPGLRQTEEVTAFPNRNDVLAAAVSLDYPALSLLVYGHPGIRTELETDPSTGEETPTFVTVGDPIVGGCSDTVIDDPTASQAVQIPLFPPPAS